MKLNIGKQFADVVKGAQICGTVKEIGVTEFKDNQNGEVRDSIYLVFEEWPDAPRYWLNKTNAVRIMAILGDETDAWKGQLIPMVRAKVNNPQTHQLVDKYIPVEVGEWHAAVAAYKQQLKGAGETRKPRR